MTRHLVSAILALAATTAAAQPTGVQALLQRGPVPTAGQKARLVRVGLLVHNLTTGQRLLEHHADQAFRPASNVKLFPAAALLYALGPDHRYETKLVAPEMGEVLPRVTLVGSGDPTLRSTGPHSLEALARRLASAGVQEIGDVTVDDGLIDRPWLVPDNETLVSAVHLADFRASKAQHGQTRDVGQFRQFEPWTPISHVEAVGLALKTQLERAGIQVTGRVRRGTTLPGDQIIASVKSAPLANLLSATLKPSNNVYAEHLFARVGLMGSEGPARPAQARAVLAAFMRRADIDPRQVLLVDGSGLSRNNRLTPNAVVQLLTFAYRHPLTRDGAQLDPLAAFKSHSNAFIEALAVAGTGAKTPEDAASGGTLARRLVGSGLNVRAKTGTIIGASALSGYVAGQSGDVLAFSMLMDGYGGMAWTCATSRTNW